MLYVKYQVMSKRVFVGLSGGVDSSVAALLLQRQGHEVAGVFLKCVNLDGCAEQDAEDARKVAAHLGIPFYSWDFEERYRASVVEPLIAGYAAGSTPNPDVACNKEIKFGAFLDAARQLGAHAVATGHYARLVQEEGATYLAAARDTEKDQTYFLARLAEDQLAHAMFPLADLTKPEVRALAAEAGLPTAAKKDSQGICFLGKISLSDYLRTRVPAMPGKVVRTDGTVIGEHDGAAFVTAGQRSGFRVTGSRGSVPTPPYYVVARDTASNVVTVAEAGDSRLLMSGARLADAAVRAEGDRVPVLVRTRYRQELAEAELVGGEDGSWTLEFARPHPIAAPGQLAVCYDRAGRVVGSGEIAETF